MFPRRLIALCLLVLGIVTGASARAGELEILIDISEQKMTVLLDDRPQHVWPVSTARAGKFTPTGLFGVRSMQRMHYSKLYHNTPMPWSIFFYGNFAIHGTDQISRLGTPASAGCVRLHPDNARTLFQMVLDNGRANTLIHIVK